MFVNHIHAFEGQELPPFGNYLMEYVTAANGVFVRAKRPGLEVVQALACAVPEGGNHFARDGAPIRGLATLEPYVKVDKRIPAKVIAWALARAREALPDEVLIWIGRNEQANGWDVCRPTQINTPIMCKPVNPAEADGQRALLDIHSHNSMPPFFSAADDEDEKGGFRLFAVLGHVGTTPEIMVRVGVFGHFSPVEAATVMDLPDGLTDVTFGWPGPFIGLPAILGEPESSAEAGNGS